MNLNRFRYDWFMKTDEWRELSEACKIRDGRKCRRCPSRSNLHAHHMFYRNRIWDTQVQDLITLCGKCHDEAHNIKRNAHGSVVRYKLPLPIKRYDGRDPRIKHSPKPAQNPFYWDDDLKMWKHK